ncbi:MAG TPA: hypothetical protein DEQ25_10435 [Methylophaga sp.]|nr:hypothetical protein [Methylophaga sp.]
MENYEEIIRELIAKLAKENLGSEHADSLLEHLSQDEWAHLEMQISAYVTNSLWKCFPSGVDGNSKNVVCALPNNLEIVSRSAAVQCQNSSCFEFFCGKHKLYKCPLCGGRVQ